MHQLIKRLVTEENVAQLGFLKSGTWEEMVGCAFSGDESVFKLVICVAQWVVLGERFRVDTAVVADR